MTKTATDRPGITDLPLNLLAPSPNNPRKRFDEASLRELGESLKGFQIEPIVVRRAATGHDSYEILAGERRWRAAKLVGMETIEAKLVVCDDQRALEITVVENLQRENLHPLEEANGVASLVAAGWPVDTIATHLGKSVSWVHLRSKLAGLSPAWRKAIDDPEQKVAQLTAGHLDLVARLASVTQDELLRDLDDWSDVRRLAFPSDNGGRPVSVQAFGRIILREFLRDPAKAPWVGADEQLTKAPACTACPLRTSQQQTLFPDHENKSGDRCTDAKCWNSKQAAFVALREKALAEKHPDLVKVDAVASHGEKPAKGALSAQMMTEAKKSDPGARPTLLISGDRAGEVVYTKPSYYAIQDGAARKAYGIKEKKDEPAAGRATSKATKAPKAKELPIAERRHRFMAAELSARLKKAKRPPLARLLRLIVMVGTSPDGDYTTMDTAEGWKRIDNPKRTAEQDQAALWDDLVEALQLSLDVVAEGDTYESVEPEAMVHIADLIAVKHADLVAAAAAKFPDVKEGLTTAKAPKPEQKAKTGKTAKKSKRGAA